MANPDFNELEEIFDGYAPDYSSDYERDRTAIITQVDLNGKLSEALSEFASQAEDSLRFINPLPFFNKIFKDSDIFISMNYTHTLEKLYGIDQNMILHIHGEVGDNNLIIGYPEGNYKPEKYYYDVRQKGRGPYVELEVEEYIERMIQDDIFDYYTYTAYDMLISKTKSFYKTPQTSLLSEFLKNKNFNEIVVLGHSCAIDFPYFEYLNNKYPEATWYFSPYDDYTKCNIENLIFRFGILNTVICKM